MRLDDEFTHDDDDEPGLADRRINDLILRLIHAGVPYETIHGILWHKSYRTKIDIIRQLYSLLSSTSP